MDTSFVVKGEITLLKNVPAEVCSRCGEKTFSAQVASRIERILRKRDALPAAALGRVEVTAVDYSKV
ncbi:MAG: YgiT-type zinc finger protein [Planctomycetes bacterium]|nr:YgiT-type zinc finger protein [Planctomycetota bacterium]